MANEIVSTLFGLEVINTAPKCSIQGCDNPADNAGYGRFHSHCAPHHKAQYQNKNGEKTKYKAFRKDYCENIDARLGFVCTSTILHANWQIDVDHIDGDKTNHDPSNLQSLCKCCHAYKTMINEENLPVAKRKKTLLVQIDEIVNNGGIR